MKAFHVTDLGPTLFVGANPTGQNFHGISGWNGIEWLNTGFPYRPNGGLRAMEVYDDGNGPQLYVGGSFLNDLNAAIPERLFRFDGSSWEAVPGANVRTVQAMGVADLGGGPGLYVIGGPASGLNRWDGSAWTQLGGPNGSVHSIAAFDDGTGMAVWVAGQFSGLLDGTPMPNVARWNGTAWTSGNGGIWSRVQTLAVYDSGSGPELFAGGGSITLPGVGRWNGVSWQNVGSGPGSWVYSLEVYDDGDGSALYAGGAFDTASNPTKRISRWDGAAWSVPGGGIGNGHVFALEVFDDGTLSAPALFVGGSFTSVDGQVAERLASWSEPATDSDGDGILDHWETEGCGIDVNLDGLIDLDLYALGARPDHKDVFVEIDAMVGRAPDPGAIADVIASFAAAPVALVNNPDGLDGVALHAIVDEVDIPLAPWPNEFADFDLVKAARFGTPADRVDANSANILDAKRRVFHYCIFADTYGTTDSSGLAERPGNDFMVTLGGWTTPGGTRDEQAGTFMHELGHNLGLRHGGDQPSNYKPNYYSIMNYTWQSPRPWQAPGSWVLDYSRLALPDLDEASLIETEGIGAPAGHYAGVLVPFNFAPDGLPPAVGLGLLEGGASVDWNGSGVISGIADGRDINHLCPNDPSSADEVLTGHSDWPNLIYDFRKTENYIEGVHPPALLSHEITHEVSMELDALLPAWGVCRSDVAPFGGDGVVGIQDLLLVLSNWGAELGSSADATGDGTVDINDLLQVLANWGPCGDA